MTAVSKSLREFKHFATFGLFGKRRHPNAPALDRQAFERQLDAEIASSGPVHARRFALLYIDVAHLKDGHAAFKADASARHGHDIGAQLSALLVPGDALARFADDAFAIRQTDGDAATSLALARRILDRLSEADFDQDDLVHARPKIGIALYPRDGTDRAEVAGHAEFALDQATRNGSEHIVLFDPQDAQQFGLRKDFAANINAAMTNDELTVAYQPVIAGASGAVVGLEALVRWLHPTQGILGPEDFIPLAEACGIIRPLGEWVLRRACRDMRNWPGLRVAINVSPVQLRHKDFVGTVAHVLKETGLEPGRLELELTEGVLIQDAVQAEAIMLELRSLGVRIALDDFGTGYSSLIYLRRFAFDKIKIDKSFLQAMEPAGEGGVIVRSIVQLGHALGLTVTAEGIETHEQARFLRSLGCDELQGFLFSAPVRADDVDATLSELAWAADAEAVPPSGAGDRSVA